MANDNTIITRAEAGVIAEQYYDEYNYIDNDDIYNPESIKEWFVTYQISRRTSSFENTRDYIEQIIISKKEINVTLSRALPLYKEPYYRVIPIHKEDKTYWIDVAGYPLAVSERITVNIDKYDYVLDSHNEVVVPSDYLT